MGDMGETWGRHGGDMGETRGRHGGDMWETCGRHVGDMWEPNYNHIRLKVMRCRFKTWPSHCVVFLSKTLILVSLSSEYHSPPKSINRWRWTVREARGGVRWDN